MLLASTTHAVLAETQYSPMNSKNSEGSDVPDDENYDRNKLPAIGISVNYDNDTEISTISWYNIDSDGLSNQEEYTALTELSTASYLVYRHTSRITSNDLQTLNPISALTVPACPNSVSYSLCQNGTNPFHEGHTVEYQISPEVSGEYYYAVVTELSDGTKMDDFKIDFCSFINALSSLPWENSWSI